MKDKKEGVLIKRNTSFTIITVQIDGADKAGGVAAARQLAESDFYVMTDGRVYRCKESGYGNGEYYRYRANVLIGTGEGDHK